MINVDIVEQLIPNPMTMAATLCSVLVLFLLVRRFLWPSVKKYLDARADAMQEELAKSMQAHNDAQKDRELARNELESASKRGEEIVSIAIREAKDEKKTILEKAEKEAEALRKEAREQMEKERVDMYSSMQKEIVDVAFAAAGKLIGEQKGEEADRLAIEAFVKEAEQNDQ